MNPPSGFDLVLQQLIDLNQEREVPDFKNVLRKLIDERVKAAANVEKLKQQEEMAAIQARNQQERQHERREFQELLQRERLEAERERREHFARQDKLLERQDQLIARQDASQETFLQVLQQLQEEVRIPRDTPIKTVEARGGELVTPEKDGTKNDGVSYKMTPLSLMETPSKPFEDDLVSGEVSENTAVAVDKTNDFTKYDAAEKEPTKSLMETPSKPFEDDLVSGEVSENTMENDQGYNVDSDEDLKKKGLISIEEKSLLKKTYQVGNEVESAELAEQEETQHRPSSFEHKEKRRMIAEEKEKMRMIAQEIYRRRTNKLEINILQIRQVMSKHPDEFARILELCPKFDLLLAYMLVFRLGMKVQEIDWTSDMKKWSEEDCRRVGRSMATLMRMVRTGLAAVDAWKKHYVQLSDLFDEVVGFEDFVVAITNNLMRDNKFGMIFRVTIGAILSTIDALTDVYVVGTYYQSEELVMKAHYLLIMILGNILLQIIVVLGLYQRSGSRVMMRETLICLLFLRPAVDAYRVSSTSNDDTTVIADSLSELVVNKCIELGAESIPGCILQLYVWLLNPDKAGTFSLVSIGISALTTGFSSAMISFDMDVDVPHRENQSWFYGYIPDDNAVRMKIFALMTLMSTMLNLGRSLGCALLATSKGGMMLVVYFTGGEMLCFFVWKVFRQDFHYWPRFTGKIEFILSFLSRVFLKVIVDYTGCVHLRHPYEMGGLVFSLSILWANVFPFVARHIVEGETSSASADIFFLLLGNFTIWLVLTIIFFCTIDVSYIMTFFSTASGPEYTVELFEKGLTDPVKFDAVFTTRVEYTEKIHDKVKVWIAENIGQWRKDKPEWFKIELIPDRLLPKKIIEEEGGVRRKRSSVSMASVLGLESASGSKESRKIVPVVEPLAQKKENEVALTRHEKKKKKDSANSVSGRKSSREERKMPKELWRGLAAEVYGVRSNSYKSNFIHIKRIFSEEEELVRELMEQCPRFREILSHILEDKFGWRVQKVDWTSEMTDWGLEECRRVGCSLATLLRKRKTGVVALDAWRVQYSQLDVLFKEIVGFEEFMLFISNNTLRDSIYGTVFRVSVGAALSIIDVATDVYVLSTYYASGVLYNQANSMLAMLLFTMTLQVLSVFVQYWNKSWRVFVREILITALFMRPAVDAYRVSTNHEDKEANMDQLSELVLNKCIELACESIPGCILQLYVWLSAPEEAGTYALVSIAISCLTTGFTSAMIAFDMDVDVLRRMVQPKFYGYIPNEHGLRGKCFMLMTLISTLHNLSRSIGYALLAASDRENFLWIFFSGEIGLHLLLKIIRRDFFYWVKIYRVLGFIGSLFSRVVTKVITDFTGCIHMRHPYELGGIGFTLSLVWAQAFPFVALQYLDSDRNDTIRFFLVACFIIWLILTFIFLCTIDVGYLRTFFGTKTGPQYTCELYLTTNDSRLKFDAVFTNRIEYTKSIHEEVKVWLGANIDRWNRERPDWFNIEMIPDELLPKDVFESEGGARRRRSSVSFVEFVGLGRDTTKGEILASPLPPLDPVITRKTHNTHPQTKSADVKSERGMQLSQSLTKNAWKVAAEEIYLEKKNDHRANIIVVREILSQNEEMFSPLLELCPNFALILCHILKDRFQFRVKKIGRTSKMTEWKDTECTKVGRSFPTFLMMAPNGEHAVDAWRLHFVQLNALFEEVEGFKEFMLVIANNLLRDSVYGLILRVSTGAILSMTDAVTDIYVIATYYKSEELYGQANAMLAMLLINIATQLCTVLAQYKGKRRVIFVKEALITISFMRPAVDAYRVATHMEGEELNIDRLLEFVINKGIELGCESIPGCILQLYVWLRNPDKAGTYALVSIGISCLTTGFTSAMMAFDMDVDLSHRKAQPKFYGYMPNDNGLRGRCYFLMTIMSAFHNLSRTLGCALLAVSNKGSLVFVLIGAELGIYLLVKIVRRDFYCWIRLSGGEAIVLSLLYRTGVKIIADFTGCFHLRHPYELGGFNFILSVVWAQAFPFVALQYFDGEIKDIMTGFLAMSFAAWLMLSIIFFCTIDLAYLNTFFGAKTGPQYTCELYLTGKDDFQKFDAIFTNRIEYTESIHGEVKDWVAANIDQWQEEMPDWFNIEMIPDELLPKDVFEAEGGAKRRRRSSVSFVEFAGSREKNVGRVRPQVGEEMRVEDL